VRIETADGSLEVREDGDPDGLTVVVHHGTPSGEDALRPAVDRDRAAMLESTPESLAEVFESLLGAAERAVLDGGRHLTLIENRVREVHEWLLAHN
jgi:hypothetical protein